MLEKNFTRQPYAMNERRGLKIMPKTVHTRPLVRNHRKRASICKRDMNTVFDKAQKDMMEQTIYSVMTPSIRTRDNRNSIIFEGSERQSTRVAQFNPNSSIRSSFSSRGSSGEIRETKLQFKAPMLDLIISAGRFSAVSGEGRPYSRNSRKSKQSKMSNSK